MKNIHDEIVGREKGVRKNMNIYNFTDYRKDKPKEKGWYVWRLKHILLKDVTVIFLAKFRKRGAGHEQVLSPEFDHWDGYRVLLPSGKIEWDDYDGEPPKAGREVIQVEGVHNVACPFCKQVPSWRYSGRFIGSGPTNTDYWYITCCKWAGVKRMLNPVQLSETRNNLLRMTIS